MKFLSPRRRLLTTIGAILIIAVAAIYFIDEPLGDHTDLEPTPRPYPEGDEGYIAWKRAADELESLNFEDFSASHIDPKTPLGEWDTAAIATALKPFYPVVDLALQAANHDDVNFPRIDTIHMDQEAQSTPFIHLASLLQFVARQQSESGDFDAACETVSVSLKLGDHIFTSGGFFIDYLLATYITKTSINRIQFVLDLPPSSDHLEYLGTQLADAPDWLRSTHQTIRSEFQFMVAGLDQSEQFETWLLSNGAPPLRFLFKRNQTKNDVAREIRQLLWNIEKTPPHITFSIKSKFSNTFWSRWKPNAYGNWLNSVGDESPIIAVLYSSVECVTLRRIALLRTALLRYRQDSNALPTHLEELVPKYLEAVPIDPFDDNPLRYDPAANIIWSIGRDLIDDRGDRTPFAGPTSEGDDLTCWIVPR